MKNPFKLIKTFLFTFTVSTTNLPIYHISKYIKQLIAANP